jgi:hypothetical protein
MANITRKWKRFLAVSCSHGFMADQAVLKEVLRFRDRWKPDTVLHLGDAIDMTCLRSGAITADSHDATVDPEADLNDGLAFISALHPQHYLLGNHEARLVTLMSHPKAIISALATRVYHQIHDRAKSIKCKVYDYKLKTGFVGLGDALFQHGYLHSENALRDSAERMCHGKYTKLVMGHIHSVGWLGDPEMAGYAENRIATTTWSRGWAWGEYTDNETIVWLTKELKDGSFKLPL